jgi:hypothetical protein
MERAHCHGIFGLSDYHQERTSPTYSQRKNRQPQTVTPHPQKQLCPKCGCPEMKCFVGAKPTIPWLAMSPDMKPIEHEWDFIGRKINQRNPKCQNIDELRTAILQELQQFP